MLRTFSVWIGIIWLGVAQFGNHAYGEERQGGSWQASDKSFAASLLFTEEHDRLLDVWSNAIGPFDFSALPTTTSVRTGDPVHVVILFVNCFKSTSDFCEMRVDFEVWRPDGAKYGSYENRILWTGQRPEQGNVRVGQPYWVFVPEAGDPVGDYRFMARIKSADGMQSMEINQTLTVSP